MEFKVLHEASFFMCDDILMLWS